MIAVMVTINEMYAQTLSKWASVSRTLSIARKACEDACFKETLDDSTVEEYQHCGHELDALTPALNNMHQSVRSKLWQLQDPKTQFFGVYPLCDTEDVAPHAIGMVTYAETAESKCQGIFDLSSGKFVLDSLTRDRFKYLCQEGKTPVFP